MGVDGPRENLVACVPPLELVFYKFLSYVDISFVRSRFSSTALQPSNLHGHDE